MHRREASLVLSPGGDAISEQTKSLLDALHREQGQMGNLQPGERFSLANGGKSIKAIFAMAGECTDYFAHLSRHLMLI